MSVSTATLVSLEQARLETAARALRTTAVVEPLWRAAKAWTAAIVLALFPFLFIVDDVVELPLSPVLPGLAVLFLLVIGLPFALMEASTRRYVRKDVAWQQKHAVKAVGVARAAVAVAAAWLLLWFMVGT